MDKDSIITKIIFPLVTVILTIMGAYWQTIKDDKDEKKKKRFKVLLVTFFVIAAIGLVGSLIWYFTTPDPKTDLNDGGKTTSTPIEAVVTISPTQAPTEAPMTSGPVPKPTNAPLITVPAENDFDILLGAAENGDIDAQYRVGYLMLNDSNYSRDEAIKWLEKAADQDQPDAVRRLAGLYTYGEYILSDTDKVISLFEKAAGLPGDGAYFAKWLGWFYDNGPQLPKDINKALYWYKIAADGEDIFAQYRRGVLLLDKNTPGHDPKEAVESLEKAADQKDLVSIHFLADRYLYGDHEDIPQDTQKALKLYKDCVDLGDADVADWLCELYTEGKFHVEKSKDEAVYWAKEAARIREQNAGK